MATETVTATKLLVNDKTGDGMKIIFEFLNDYVLKTMIHIQGPSAIYLYNYMLTDYSVFTPQYRSNN